MEQCRYKWVIQHGYPTWWAFPPPFLLSCTCALDFHFFVLLSCRSMFYRSATLIQNITRKQNVCGQFVSHQQTVWLPIRCERYRRLRVCKLPSSPQFAPLKTVLLRFHIHGIWASAYSLVLNPEGTQQFSRPLHCLLIGTGISQSATCAVRFWFSCNFILVQIAFRGRLLRVCNTRVVAPWIA